MNSKDAEIYGKNFAKWTEHENEYKKTNVLVCSRNNNIRARIHLQNHQAIEQVEGFTYLGSIINEDGRSKKEIIKRTCQAKISFNKKRGLLLQEI